MATYDYLIIGASAAGLAAAEAIKDVQPSSTLLMVSAEPYAPYGRPLISYLIEGKTTEDRLALRDEGYFEQRGIQCGFGPEFKVTKLDADAHRATFASRKRVTYGKCLIATGSVPFVPDVPGIEGASNVYGFFTLDDAKAAWEGTAQATQQAHEQGRTSRVVVSGGGLTGMKAAEALSYHADEVVVVGHNARLLKNALDLQGTVVLKQLIEGCSSIVCRTGVGVESADCQDGRVTAIHLSNGEELPCDALVMAVGVRPATALAKAAGAAVERGIVVDECLQTSLPDVYAAGDVVQVRNALTGKAEVMALWGNAVRQGRIAGLHMAGEAAADPTGESSDEPAVEPYLDDMAENAVDFFDISLLSCGIVNPSPDDGCAERVWEGDGTYAKFVIRDDRLVGYVLINRPECAGIYNAIIRNRIPASQLPDDVFERAPQLIDFEPDLRKRYARGEE